MNGSNESRRWIYFALSPLFLVMLFAFASSSADAAPGKARRVSPKTPIVQNAAGKKTPQFQNAKNRNKSKKANSGKKNMKKHHHAKKHHKKHHHHRRHARRASNSGSSNLTAQLQRDESRLMADLNRLKKVLR